MQGATDKPLFIVAEYWSHEVDKLQQYIDLVDGNTMLFDAPLQMKFHEASRQGPRLRHESNLHRDAGGSRPIPCGHVGHKS